jgi:hypothetical protein
MGCYNVTVTSKNSGTFESASLLRFFIDEVLFHTKQKLSKFYAKVEKKVETIFKI